MLAAAALLLVGCAAPGSGGGLPDSPHTATLEIDGQSFTFAPATCETSTGYPKVSGQGVNHSVDEPVFLDMDIAQVDGWPEGKAFVYLNSVDGTPGDEYFVGEAGSGDDYSMGNMMDGFEVELLLRSHDGTDIGTGVFLINCG